MRRTRKIPPYNRAEYLSVRQVSTMLGVGPGFSVARIRALGFEPDLQPGHAAMYRPAKVVKIAQALANSVLKVASTLDEAQAVAKAMDEVAA